MTGNGVADGAAAHTTSEHEREAQKRYWEEHSKQPTVDAMMLDSKAAEIDLLERPEVLSTLGPVAGKRVLELGAGIGRFTGELADNASHVLACDFMATSIAENKRTNGHRHNVSFAVADVTELEQPSCSFDVVFSNWLLMYLSDAEVLKLANNSLSWLKDGGVLFFRESCYKQSGDRARKDNPTHYRNPRDYFKLFDSAQLPNADGSTSHFELDVCKCVDTYVKVKRNQNQICWRWTKVTAHAPRPPVYRHFLDTQQYSSTGILRYERVYGDGFVCSGGADTTRQLVARLALQPGQRVLDIGCGIGGAALQIASEHNVHVHGLDLSANMVLLALERALDKQGDVVFEVADALTREFQEGSFDAIYSRDTLLHIHDKPNFLKRVLRWLKPGGKLLMTDYCRSEAEPSAEFAAYIKQRNYALCSLDNYKRLFTDAGFEEVVAEDRSADFEACLKAELEQVESGRQEFVAAFSQADYEEVLSSWQGKLRRVAAGEQRWGLLMAKRPQATAAHANGTPK